MGFFNRAAAPIDYDRLSTEVAVKVAASMPATVAVQPQLLPRDEFGQGFPFGAGIPLTPYAIDPTNPMTGRPDPRRTEFPSSVNLQITSTRLLPFQVLRDVSERVDVIRRCIELRKSQMIALDWDIVISRQAIKRIMVAEGITSQGKASQLAREKYSNDMVRLRAWWEKPDRFNGQNFSAWLALLLEEQLVLDAPTLWPRRKANGEVVAIEILDGSTIKPLIDHRGSTPVAPNPAYQQILYGFPRGEFTASDSDAPDGYTFDQIMYRPRHVRTWTPYGSPSTEQALAAADVYLKRMAWIRGEFTEGTVPDTWLRAPSEAATGKHSMNPDNIRAWEAAINAELSGQDAERRHLRMLPPGYIPDQMKNFAELYKSDLDDFLIKIICMCFDCMPTEIGFAPKGGIGGKGHQEGEANSAQRKAIRPTAAWIEGLLTDISREWLGMSSELEFKLLGYEIEDQNAEEVVSDSQVRRGGIVLNEDRAARGLPLYDFPEADEPFIVAPSGIVFLRGAIAAQAQAATVAAQSQVPGVAPAETAVEGSASNPSPETPVTGDPIADGEPVPDGFVRIAGHLRAKPGAKVAEAAKFVSFAAKRAGRTWRDFEFEHLDRWEAAELNAAGRAGDGELVKSLVADVGKARARIVSRADKDKLIAKHGPQLAAVVRKGIPSADSLIGGWNDAVAADKSVSEHAKAAQTYVEDAFDIDEDELDSEIEDLQTAGHGAAWHEIAFADPDLDNPPSRLKALWDSAPDALIAGVIGLTVDALLSQDPESNLDTVTNADADAPWADTFASNELTPALSAGSLDVAEQYGMKHVRITASAGECDFCAEYDGRIMELDDESGMPPLHRGCACDIEPLD